MKIFALLLVCLAVFACAPPYIEELDSVAGLARKMTVVGTIGPVKGSFGNGQNAMTFLPVKPTAAVAGIGDLSVQSGFTITEDGGYQYLQFAYVDSSGQVQLTSNVSPFLLAGVDPNYPQYEFDVTTGTTAAANVVVLNMASTVSSASTFYSATLPTGPLSLVAGPTGLNGLFSGYTNVLGVQMAPSPPDTFNFLLWDGTKLAEGSATTTGSAFAATTAFPNSNLAASIPPTRTLYFMSPLGQSYASFVQGGEWVCYQWMPSGVPSKLPLVTHRIDAVLTSGDLLSTDGGILRLYDPNGSLVRSVSLGGLQFCYEAYVGPTTPYVFFSLAIELRQDYWVFRVYAVPTSSIRGLGG